jgi:hypothetical protein
VGAACKRLWRIRALNDADYTATSLDWTFTRRADNPFASFAAGITTNQLWFRHVGTTLEVSISGTSDKLTLSNWYTGSAYHVEQLKTADKTADIGLIDLCMMARFHCLAVIEYSSPTWGAGNGNDFDTKDSRHRRPCWF